MVNYSFANMFIKEWDLNFAPVLSLNLLGIIQLVSL